MTEKNRFYINDMVYAKSDICKKPQRIVNIFLNQGVRYYETNENRDILNMKYIYTFEELLSPDREYSQEEIEKEKKEFAIKILYSALSELRKEFCFNQISSLGSATAVIAFHVMEKEIHKLKESK